MRRKLIQHGLSSLTISLPRRWVVANNLSKGDEVEVEESAGGISITTNKRPSNKNIEVDISGAGPMIRKMIGATYKSGYDEASIRFGTHEELKAAQWLMREQFSGFEIIDQSKNRIVIKNVSGHSFDEFDNMLRRLFFIGSRMAQEISEAVEKDEFEWLRNIALMKIESDKYADYCRRAINSGHDVGARRTGPLYTIIEQSEKTVDRYKELCDLMPSEKIKLSGRTKAFIKKLAGFQRDFNETIFSFEIRKMIEFGTAKTALQKELDRIAAECPKKEIKIVTLLDRILNLIFDMNGPLMAMKI